MVRPWNRAVTALGGVVHVRADGCLADSADDRGLLPRTQWGDDWHLAVEDATSEVSRVLLERGVAMVGVYVRGSIPRGLARPGVSDVDLVVVTWSGGDGEPDGDEGIDGGGDGGGGGTKSREADEDEAAADVAAIRRCLAVGWSGRWLHIATKADVRVLRVPRPSGTGSSGTSMYGGDIDGGTSEQAPGDSAVAAAETAAAAAAATAAAAAAGLRAQDLFVLAAESATVSGGDLES